jgi:hypothetical protein
MADGGSPESDSEYVVMDGVRPLRSLVGRLLTRPTPDGVFLMAIAAGSGFGKSTLVRELVKQLRKTGLVSVVAAFGGMPTDDLRPL